MIEIGRTTGLTVIRETEVGYYLADSDGNEVLMPLSITEKKYNLKELVEVFIYTDSENRQIASPRRPYAQLNDFVYLRVNSVQEFGAFMDWGLEKDLFVPYNEQKQKMEVDEFYVVYIYLDEETQRLAASSRLDSFISTAVKELEVAQEVDVLVYEESDLGFSGIINNKFKGLIYHNDIFKDVYIGDEMKGYVKNIREDQLIDLSFQKSGFKNVLDSTDVVMDYLEKNKGFLDLHDKSSPEEISIRLSMSKATFKKAIGILYRHRKVLIKPDGVYLVKAE
jgi:hypothetical protein